MRTGNPVRLQPGDIDREVGAGPNDEAIGERVDDEWQARRRRCVVVTKNVGTDVTLKASSCDITLRTWSAAGASIPSTTKR